MQRFPLATAEEWNGVQPMPIKIAFTWYDLYEGGGMFRSVPLLHSSIKFIFTVRKLRKEGDEKTKQRKKEEEEEEERRRRRRKRRRRERSRDVYLCIIAI